MERTRKLRWREHLVAFAVICAVHAAALWTLTATWRRPVADVTPPRLVGVLVYERSPPAMPAPEAEPVEPKPTAASRPRPAPLPVRSAAVPVSPPPAPAAGDSGADRDEASVAAPASPMPADEAPLPPLQPPRADAAFLDNPAPAYPPLSRRLREQGRVLLDVLIRADGSVGEVRLKRSSGFPRLDQAALEAVRRWRYLPAKRGGTPIDYWHVQPLDFELERR